MIKQPQVDSLNCQQLLVVITDNWDNIGGKLYCFEKHGGKWVKQSSNQVVVGQKGLGVGAGIVNVDIPGAPRKREGDMKSPAGIFRIGTAFGYADKNEVEWLKVPYVKASDTLICVDDGKSTSYNQLVNNDPGKSDWHSFEHMHIAAYKWGLFVNHNTNSAVPGMGSCIFLHIWKNKKEGTAGCTAMKEKNILKLLHWLDQSKNPLLVQLPANEYLKLMPQFDLPAFKIKS